MDNSKYVATDPLTGVLTFPADVELDIDALSALIQKNVSRLNEYQTNENLYTGNHSILNSAGNVSGINEKLVVSMPYYLVNTFNGYFIGNEPTISLSDDAKNEELNDWLNENSFADMLNETSKQVDILGKCYIYVYQNEQSQTKVAMINPDNAFMVYDDTIAKNRLAFVRYWNDYNGNQIAEVSFANEVDTYNVSTGKMIDSKPNIYQQVPAVEFYSNSERSSLFQPVTTLCNELDKVLSSKANQVAYFDNAYLKVLGLDLRDPETGELNFDIAADRMLYSPDPDAKDAVVDFVAKPDGDVQQEHLIERLIDLIFQTSMIANLNDKVFSGNSSGVALEYKLLPMKNLAKNKERKFTQQLRELFGVVFSLKEAIDGVSEADVKDIEFTFTRNLPTNVDAEASAAQKLDGIVSKKTQLSTMSFVKDPQKEMDEIDKENTDKAVNAVKNSQAAMSWDKKDDE